MARPWPRRTKVPFRAVPITSYKISREERFIAGEQYHAFAHAVRVDVLALGGSGSARDRIEVRAYCTSRTICGLDRSRRLHHFGDRLHRQDDVKVRSGGHDHALSGQ